MYTDEELFKVSNPKFTKSDLIHSLIIRRAEEERERILAEKFHQDSARFCWRSTKKPKLNEISSCSSTDQTSTSTITFADRPTIVSENGEHSKPRRPILVKMSNLVSKLRKGKSRERRSPQGASSITFAEDVQILRPGLETQKPSRENIPTTPHITSTEGKDATLTRQPRGLKQELRKNSSKSSTRKSSTPLKRRVQVREPARRSKTMSKPGYRTPMKRKVAPTQNFRSTPSGKTMSPPDSAKVQLRTSLMDDIHAIGGSGILTRNESTMMHIPDQLTCPDRRPAGREGVPNISPYEQYINSIINKSKNQGVVRIYEPYEHRTGQQLTNWGAFMHLLRALVGVNLLKMPHLYKMNGLYKSFAITIGFFMVLSFNMHIIILTQHRICVERKLPWLSIGDTVRAAVNMGPVRIRKFANKTARVVETCVIIKQLTRNIYLVRYLSLLVWKTYEIRGAKFIPPPSMLTFYFMLPFVYVTSLLNLRNLQKYSVIGNLFMILTVVQITPYIARDLTDVNMRKKPLAFLSLSEFLVLGFLTTDVMEVGLAIESHMKSPKSFSGLLGVFNMSIAIAAIFLTIIGFFGYWKYGEDVEPFFIDNMEFRSKTLAFITASFIIMSAACLALHAYLPSKILWRSFMMKELEDSPHPKSWERLLRVLFATTMFVISFVPTYSLHIAIATGAALIPIVSMMLPAALEILVFWNRSFKRKWYTIARDVFVIILSLSLSVVNIVFVAHGWCDVE